MKYMLLIYGDENLLTQDDREACYEESLALCRDIDQKGKLLGASPLHPTATATSLQVRDGNRVITDGPFAETKEQLGGYFLVNADDLDDALAIAERIPAAKWGTVEVRPIIELPGLS
jgi:hypothetical protein